MNRKSIASMAACAAFIIAGAGIVPAQSAITVTDMAGREVSLSAPAERIVSLSAAACETLNAIGGLDLIVARDSTCDYPDEIESVPVIESGDVPDIEEIISLSPDIVLIDSADLTEEQLGALDESGIPAAICDADNLDGIYTSVGMLGTLTGKEDISDIVIDAMLSNLEILIEPVKHMEGEPETIYIETASSEEGLLAAGSGTLVNEMAELIGLKNIFSDLDGYASVTPEMVAEKSPDHIISVAPDNTLEPAPETEILSRPGWEDIPAVKNLSVKAFQDHDLVRSGPRVLEGAVALYNFIYGGGEALTLW